MKVSKLSDISWNKRFMQLKHPYTDEGLEGEDGKPLGFTVHPLKSEVLRSSVFDFQRRLAVATEEEKTDPAFIQEAELRLYSKSIVSWSHEDFFGPFSDEAAFELLGRAESQFIKKQLEEFLKAEESFFGA